jgi:hypothetical protein
MTRQPHGEHEATTISIRIAMHAGHVLVRPAPQNVQTNGKSFHIHTFGCQVRKREPAPSLSLLWLPPAASMQPSSFSPPPLR